MKVILECRTEILRQVKDRLSLDFSLLPVALRIVHWCVSKMDFDGLTVHVPIPFIITHLCVNTVKYNDNHRICEVLTCTLKKIVKAPLTSLKIDDTQNIRHISNQRERERERERESRKN
jgi:hypothetical protein